MTTMVIMTALIITTITTTIVTTAAFIPTFRILFLCREMGDR